MKRHKDLYAGVYDFQNLEVAYRKARRGKRYREEVLEFSASLEENLIEIQNELIWKTYRTGKYRQFYVYEPKVRLILALPFRDRVVHHALCNVIEPIFEKTFIDDSYACRVNKGTHAGVDRLTGFLRRAQRIWERPYCLKADIAQYFPSVDHETLVRLYRKKIGCPDTLWLLSEIIGSTSEADGTRARGLPIGNLTSQLSANIYLNELDHFVKGVLGVRFYVRYMDDFVILDGCKGALRGFKEEIERFLEDRLWLRYNKKTGIFPIAQGVDFLGYRIWSTHRLLRKNSIKRMRRKLRGFQKGYAAARVERKEIEASLRSWLGHCSHCDSYNLRKRLLGGLRLRR